MMEWIPIVLVTFKVLVLATGMYFAIKWHYDQGKKKKNRQRDGAALGGAELPGAERRAVLRATGMVAAIFVVSLLVLGVVAFGLLNMLGNDLTLP